MDKLLAEFAAIGIAQALPGLRRMREVAIMGMNAEIAKLEALLAQCGGVVPVARRPAGRPKKESAVIAAARQIEAAQNGVSRRAHSYWAAMTPEERSAEMVKRHRKSGQRKRGQPNKAATGTGGIRGMSKTDRSKLSKSYWDRMTPEERVKEMNRRLAVRIGKAESINPQRYELIKVRRAEVQA
jgi:hypothetical protein